MSRRDISVDAFMQVFPGESWFWPPKNSTCWQWYSGLAQNKRDAMFIPKTVSQHVEPTGVEYRPCNHRDLQSRYLEGLLETIFLLEQQWEATWCPMKQWHPTGQSSSQCGGISYQPQYMSYWNQNRTCHKFHPQKSIILILMQVAPLSWLWQRENSWLEKINSRSDWQLQDSNENQAVVQEKNRKEQKRRWETKFCLLILFTVLQSSRSW